MRPEPSGSAPRASHGLTLIELVVALVVVAIAVTGTLQVLGSAMRQSADPMLTEQGGAVARAYLEEILTKAFAAPPCAPPPASRELYQSLCDYHGLDDPGARDQQGQAIAGLEAFRVRVDVDPSATLGGLAGPSDVVRVDVRVTHGSSVDVLLSGYRTAY
jgi:MSHA pilin protein MshD